MTNEMSPRTRVFARASYQVAGDAEAVRLEFVETVYANGQTAILARLEETHEPYATLSAIVGDEPLDQGEFYLKTWSENAELWQILLSTGAIEKIQDAEPIHTGFALAYLYRVAA